MSDATRAHKRALFKPSLFAHLRGGYNLARLRDDVFGGLTAAVVALPLALAFGVASGAGAIAGLYGAIAVGLFASLFGGTPAQVSGPTGPMSVVMGAVIATHSSNLAEAFTIVMLGGAIQIAFGVARVGKYVTYTPYSVVSGFMTGIGAIIILIEILLFFGLPTARGGAVGAMRTIASINPTDINPAALALAGGSLAALVVWPSRLQRFLPAPLGVLIVATLVTYAGGVSVATIGDVPQGLPSLVMPSLSLASLPGLVQAGFVLALLGSIDSLLTSLVADSVTRTRHDADKELVGQGIGNLAAGLIGALPGAGATMRTVINVRAGGRTPISGALHALALLALALGFGGVVSHVPHAVLAAILMKVGWDIIDWGYIRRIGRVPAEKAAVMVVTAALTIFVGLITAVAVGIILASYVTSHRLAEEQLKGISACADPDALEQLDEDERALLRPLNGKVVVTQLAGTFSYASARELAARGIALSGTECRAIVYDFASARYIDASAAMAIDEMFADANGRGIAVFVAGLSGQARRALDGMGVLDRVAAAHVFDERTEAIRAAVELVGREA